MCPFACLHGFITGSVSLRSVTQGCIQRQQASEGCKIGPPVVQAGKGHRLLLAGRICRGTSDFWLLIGNVGCFLADRGSAVTDVLGRAGLALLYLVTLEESHHHCWALLLLCARCCREHLPALSRFLLSLPCQGRPY